MRALLTHLATASPQPDPMADIDAWWTVHRGVVRGFSATVDVAAGGGFAADRLGWAFASGYQAALGALLPGGAVGRPVALCATEEDGAHPRDIHTALTEPDQGGRRLSGSKCFVTLGARADLLVVIASKGRTPLGRNTLRAVLVDKQRDGITVEDQAPLPYVPEVPHGVVTFADVPVGAEDVLPGDGYDRYLKPFRTIEDLHVQAAALGHAVQLVRRAGGEGGLVDELLATLTSIHALAGEDPLDPAIHLALGGLETQRRRLLDRVDAVVEGLGGDTLHRWRRDRPLLSIASRVRQRRLEAARRSLLEQNGTGERD